MEGWQKIYSTDMPFRAEIVRFRLERQKYNPVLLNKKDSSYLFGNYEVYVACEHVLKAIKIISDELWFE
ncbi:MAG TPA: hypothetical protein VNW99_01670 [Cytophagaceae bacterium]|jgi:hypothetical protein|nr:hypothetical protein [Cytophagaceae bacterium]